MPPKKQHDKTITSPTAGKQLSALAAASTTTQGMALTNYAEEQQQELEVLKAIYMDDLEKAEAKPAAWGKSADLAFNIRIKAQSNDAIAVTLHVELPATYPKTFPVLRIKDLESGNPGVPAKLQRIIMAKPQKFLGTAMIYEYCDQVQEVLNNAANVKADKEGLHSLEEERFAREAAADREAAEREQEMLQKQEDETAEEDRLLAEQVRRERERRDQKARQSRPISATIDIGGVDFSPDSVTFDQPMVTRDMRGENTFNFQIVLGKTVILKTKVKKVTLVTPVAEEHVMVPQLLLKDIYLTEKQSDSAGFRQKMRGIEELLEDSKVHRHANVVELLGYKIQRSVTHPGDQSESAATWELSILSEYANKSSLSELLDIVESLEPKNVRSWTHQLLDALEFFDQNGYIHPAVHLGNVLLFRSPTGGMTVKLSDGYGTALKALVMQSKTQAGFTSSETPFWTAPEMNHTTPTRTNKTCIWDLGVIMLQMVLGKDVIQRYTSPTTCVRSSNLSEPLEDMLEKMFQSDHKKRPKAFELPNLAFIHDDNGPLFRGESPEAPSTPYRRRHDSSMVLPSRSKFETEWSEVTELGKGGFGKVVKARQRSDGGFYALKIVVGDSPADLAKDLSEAKLLARTNNPYVVRYYQVWDERESGFEHSERRASLPESEEAVVSYGDDPFALPSTGHDFMSTSHYGNVGIQFGNDSDEDQADEDGDELARLASKDFSTDEDDDAVDATDSQAGLINRRQSRIPQTPRPTKCTLYIQMEFCENRTLRHLIKEGSGISIDDGWRFFQQILEGLRHIHGLGIVHRDLKPDNIFIDSENNPKIGDFGLATVGHFTAATHGSGGLTAGPETRSIGTMYYVAPELGSRGSGVYSARVDMYSLGIIFFEMCYPLKTFMERDQELRNIRKAEHKLPALFDGPEFKIQGEIIEDLLSHRQRNRPTARELLAGGRIPEPLEEEKFRRYLHGLTDTGSPEYQKMLSTVFSEPVKKIKNLAWDDKTPHAVFMTESLLAMLVKEKIRAIFVHHGAVEIDRPGVFPKSEHYSVVAKVLEESGTLLQLPYDLTLPFARLVAHQRPDFEKAFSFGTVYRPTSMGTEPFRFAEVDFDILSDKSTDLALKEAEVIKVLDEIVEEFPALRSKPVCFVVNHSDLLDLVLHYCRIKPEQRDRVKQVLSKLNVKTESGRQTWQRIRGELRTPLLNIPATSLDDLKRFDFREDLDGARAKLEALFENSSSFDQLGPILTRIDAVRAYLARFHVKAKVYISPLSNYSERLYRGSLLFQCIDDSSKIVIAAGGRYDSLIEEYQPKSTMTQTRAVGLQLNLAEILHSIQGDGTKSSRNKFLKNSITENPLTLTPRRCDVLVTSFDAAVLRTSAIEMVQELWANGISAELTGDFNTLEELGMAFKKDFVGWIIIVRHDGNAFGTRNIKVRSLVKKEDTEVRVGELVGWLRGEIRERNGREGTRDHVISRLRREASQGEASAAAGDAREPNVQILTPQHRGKKTNRRAILDSAAARTGELVEQFLSDSPIAAVELGSDELLDAIRTKTRLSDPDSWRMLVQSVPLQESKYLQQVFDLLLEMASAGSRFAFVFNYRTRGCILYDLYRS